MYITSSSPGRLAGRCALAVVSTCLPQTPGDALPRAGPVSRRMGPMTVVKINAITVPSDSGDELAHRFAARAGAVDGQPGFEGFELLKPVDGRTQWLVVTRWADEVA